MSGSTPVFLIRTIVVFLIGTVMLRAGNKFGETRIVVGAELHCVTPIKSIIVLPSTKNVEKRLFAVKALDLLDGQGIAFSKHLRHISISRHKVRTWAASSIGYRPIRIFWQRLICYHHPRFQNRLKSGSPTSVFKHDLNGWLLTGHEIKPIYLFYSDIWTLPHIHQLQLFIHKFRLFEHSLPLLVIDISLKGDYNEKQTVNNNLRPSLHPQQEPVWFAYVWLILGVGCAIWGFTWFYFGLYRLTYNLRGGGWRLTAGVSLLAFSCILSWHGFSVLLG